MIRWYLIVHKIMIFLNFIPFILKISYILKEKNSAMQIMFCISYLSRSSTKEKKTKKASEAEILLNYNHFLFCLFLKNFFFKKKFFFSLKKKWKKEIIYPFFFQERGEKKNLRNKNFNIFLFEKFNKIQKYILKKNFIIKKKSLKIIFTIKNIFFEKNSIQKNFPKKIYLFNNSNEIFNKLLNKNMNFGQINFQFLIFKNYMKNAFKKFFLIFNFIKILKDKKKFEYKIPIENIEFLKAKQIFFLNNFFNKISRKYYNIEYDLNLKQSNHKKIFHILLLKQHKVIRIIHRRIFESKTYQFSILNQFYGKIFSFLILFLIISTKKFFDFWKIFFSFSNLIIVIFSSNQIFRKYFEREMFILTKFVVILKKVNHHLIFSKSFKIFEFNSKFEIIFNQINNKKPLINIFNKNKNIFYKFFLFFVEILNFNNFLIKKKKLIFLIKKFLIFINFLANFFYFSEKKKLIKNFFFFVKKFFNIIFKKNIFLFFLYFGLIKNKKTKNLCFLIGLIFILFKKYFQRSLFKFILKIMYNLCILKMEKKKRILFIKKNRTGLIFLKKNIIGLDISTLCKTEKTFFYLKTKVNLSVFILACFFITNNLKKKTIFRIIEWFFKNKNKIFHESALFVSGLFFFLNLDTNFIDFFFDLIFYENFKIIKNSIFLLGIFFFGTKNFQIQIFLSYLINFFKKKKIISRNYKKNISKKKIKLLNRSLQSILFIIRISQGLLFFSEKNFLFTYYLPNNFFDLKIFNLLLFFLFFMQSLNKKGFFSLYIILFFINFKVFLKTFKILDIRFKIKTINFKNKLKKFFYLK